MRVKRWWGEGGTWEVRGSLYRNVPGHGILLNGWTENRYKGLRKDKFELILEMPVGQGRSFDFVGNGNHERCPDKNTSWREQGLNEVSLSGRLHFEGFRGQSGRSKYWTYLGLEFVSKKCKAWVDWWNPVGLAKCNHLAVLKREAHFSLDPLLKASIYCFQLPSLLLELTKTFLENSLQTSTLRLSSQSIW